MDSEASLSRGQPATGCGTHERRAILARMASLVQKLVRQEHHLEDIAREGYAPATLPIVLAGVIVALIVIVGVALAVALLAYYLV